MQKELTNKIKNIQITTNCCDILIRSSAVLVPAVKCTSNFLLSYENKKAIIEEKIDSSSECTKENDGIVMQSLKKANTLLNDNVVIVNGKVVKGTICSISNLEGANDILEVYVPRNSSLKYHLNSIGGDISVYGISSSFFAAKTICGSIDLMDMNSESIYINSNSSDMYLNSIKTNNININSVSGSVDIKIDDYRNNYILENYTIYGNVGVISYDEYIKSNSNTNKKIYVDTFSGDIDIMFRGIR